MAKECPKCGLINPQDAFWCDCGYAWPEGVRYQDEQEKQAKKEAEESSKIEEERRNKEQEEKFRTPHKKETIELQKLIELGKKKGFLTYEEINAALPQEGFSIEDMDNLLEMLGDMRIEVVDGADKERSAEEPAKEKHAALYKKGDFIGKDYEVYDVLGMGGFGIVYLVYSHEIKSVYALKTFRDEYLWDKEAVQPKHR